MIKLLPVRVYVPHASPVVGFHGQVVECFHTQVDSTPIAHNGIHYPLKKNEQGQSNAYPQVRYFFTLPPKNNTQKKTFLSCTKLLSLNVNHSILSGH